MLSLSRRNNEIKDKVRVYAEEIGKKQPVPGKHIIYMPHLPGRLKYPVILLNMPLVVVSGIALPYFSVMAAPMYFGKSRKQRMDKVYDVKGRYLAPSSIKLQSPQKKKIMQQNLTFITVNSDCLPPSFPPTLPPIQCCLVKCDYF